MKLEVNIVMKLYSAKTSQEIDRYAIETHLIPGILLMKRAGWASFNTLLSEWPDARHITVVCGTGNNGGDGFVIAQYATIHGLTVKVAILGDQSKIRGDARIAYNELLQTGITPIDFSNLALSETDVIVDALFGTGLSKPIEGDYRTAILRINDSHKPVLAVDMASGVHADTGAVLGVAVKAQHTCTFITRKLGQYTAYGESLSGQVHYHSLGVGQHIIRRHPPIAVNHGLATWLHTRPKREAHHHKGSAGTSCLIGGNKSMMGAIQLAGLAALKTGSGLTKIISRAKHNTAITQSQPELMCYPKSQLMTQCETADAIAIGPGLGTDTWATKLFEQVMLCQQVKVIDADALRLFRSHVHTEKPNWILTPHPGEAASLLGIRTQDVQNDRVSSIKALHKTFGGVIVLKGNGTLIYDGDRLEVCTAGNPGMAVGGMGDVLTGILVSLLAQGLSLWDAANLGVTLHAHAGDAVAKKQGEAGVLPSEVAHKIGRLLAT